MDDLRYPIGRFEFKGAPARETVDAWIGEIGALPDTLRKTCAILTPERLEERYRPGGWTLRQVVHHIGDSHMNALMRQKLALTEDRPVIKTYREERWAELADYTGMDIEDELNFIALLHKKWTIVLRSLTGGDLTRVFVHPESGPMELGTAIGMYAWHGNHHLAHISRHAQRMGWI